jgi:hypothetical protein
MVERDAVDDASLIELADHDPSYDCVCRRSEVDGAGLTQCLYATGCDKEVVAVPVTHVHCDVVAGLVSQTKINFLFGQSSACLSGLDCPLCKPRLENYRVWIEAQCAGQAKPYDINLAAGSV